MPPVSAGIGVFMADAHDTRSRQERRGRLSRSRIETAIPDCRIPAWHPHDPRLRSRGHPERVPSKNAARRGVDELWLAKNKAH